MNQKLSRKERASNTKRKLFETAVKLIKEKGYHRVTVSEISREAGVAKGSFYVHYQSKEDIVRESYYIDMGEYIQRYYQAFLSRYPDASYKQRMIYFMNLELEFAEFAGYELTCLAYALNLSACVPGPSEHLKKRIFSKILYQEIVNHADKNSTDFNSDEIFCYFESVIRGLMASWCFSNHDFSLIESGKKYIPLVVSSIYPERE